MNDYVIVRYANLPTTIPGFSIRTPDEYTTIILNARCGHNKNIESFMHEMKHISDDDFYSIESVDAIELRTHGGKG